MNLIEELEKIKAEGHRWYNIYSCNKNYPTNEQVKILRDKGYDVRFDCSSEEHDYTVCVINFYPEKPLPIRTKNITVTLTVRYEAKKFSEKLFADILLNRMDNFGVNNCNIQEYVSDNVSKQSKSYKYQLKKNDKH